MRKRSNAGPFQRLLEAGSRTTFHGKIRTRGGKRKATARAGKQSVYKGVRIIPLGNGEFETSLDSSRFDSKRDAKRFVDSWRRNPTWTGRKMTQAERDAAYAEEDREREAAEQHAEWTRKQQEKQLKRRNPRGSKGKFQRCVESVAARGTAADPKAVCGAMEKRLKNKRNPKPELTQALARAAAEDAANRKMRKAGRTSWSRADYNEAVRRFNRLWPTKHNPAEGAAKAYRDFHGRAPDESVTISRQVHFHRHLAAAGELRRLDGETIDGGKFSLRWGRGEKPILAFNEQRNQLFIEGGKQAVDLAAFGIKSPHELETLGRVTHIDYFARKDHLGDEGGTAIYRHKFRTVNQDGKPVTVKILRFPDLIYRVRDKHLEFSGGSYTIEPEGIDK